MRFSAAISVGLVLAWIGTAAAQAPADARFKPRQSNRFIPPVSFPMEKIEELFAREAKVKKLPRMFPEGWTKGELDMRLIVDAFAPLRLKKGYTLRTYHLGSRDASWGFVWAMPENLPYPSPGEAPIWKGHPMEPPRPAGVLDDPMDAIEGDGTPWSYVCASILKRELAEFGARGSAVGWTYDRILDKNPWTSGLAKLYKTPIQGPTGEPKDWSWLEREPRDWPPAVQVEPDKITVTFHTYSGLKNQAIYRNVDVYKPGTYRSTSDRRVVVQGPAGFIN